MGMIDDQTTGPWLKKKQQKENISVLKVNHHIQYQLKKKKTFVFVLIMIYLSYKIYEIKVHCSILFMVYMYFSYSELKKVLLFYFRLVTNQLTKQWINQSNQLLSYQWYKTLETFVYIQNMQRNWSYMYMHKIVESVSIIFTERFCENDN